MSEKSADSEHADARAWLARTHPNLRAEHLDLLAAHLINERGWHELPTSKGMLPADKPYVIRRALALIAARNP